MPTIAHLRRLAVLLPGSIVYTRKECVAQGHPFDPPCAYLSVTNTGGRTAKVCVDGETFLSRDGMPEQVFEIDLSNPKTAARQIWTGPSPE